MAGLFHLKRLRTRITLAEEEDVALELAVADLQRRRDDVVEGDLADLLDLLRREHAVVDVLEPEAVGVADARELLFDDGGEEGAGTVRRLEHAAQVDVDVVQILAVEFGQPLEELRLAVGQRRIDVAPLGDGRQAEAAPRRVVVGQARVAAAHDVQRAEIAPRELHRSEQFVAHVRAQDAVLAFGQLRRHAQNQFLHRVHGQHLQ